jgi:hypothetical protein
MGKRTVVELSVRAALVAAAAMLLLPATASADGALVFNQGHGLECQFSVGGNTYRGSGTQVVNPSGNVKLSCHLSLVSGTPVAHATKTTVGLCEVIETPSGQANASCPPSGG